MNWLARLKNIDTTPTAEATKPTKPGFVGSVAPHIGVMQNTHTSDAPAANDAAQVYELVADDEVTSLVTVETAVRKQPERSEVRTETRVSTGKVSTLVSSPAPVLQDPDRWCWPHTQAMNTAEIDTFMARLARFTDKGMALEAAEALADRLVARDREADARRVCLECAHLAGRAEAWECRNWQQAAIASKARDAQLSPALVFQPQRCDGFKAAT